MTVKSLQRPCPICAATDGVVLHHQSFGGYDASPLPTEYDIVACERCGFVYADVAATQQDYDLYYRTCSKYEDPTISSGTGLHEWEVDRFRRTAETVAALLPDRDAHIVDIGCAAGGLLVELERLGYRHLHGMDHAAACTAAVRGRGFGAVEGGVTDPPFERLGRRFDGVVLSHVMEHVLDLGSAVRNCRELLVDGGVLYVEVPDATRYPEFAMVPYYFFDCEHINHFSTTSLRNLFEPAGFVSIESGSKHFHASANWLYPATWLGLRAIQRPSSYAFALDRESAAGVRRHAEESATADVYGTLERLADGGAPIIVWGAGSYAQRLLGDSPLGRCNIAFFIDNDANKQGKTLRGIPIRLPEAVTDPTMPIIVCAALFSEDIERQIRSLGLANPVVIAR